MTEFKIQSAASTPANRGQCSIAAARRNRFWRACNKAFLPIHLVALAIVGFMVGDGWLFWLVAASIVVGPVLSYFDHVYGDAELPAAEQHEPAKAES